MLIISIYTIFNIESGFLGVEMGAPLLGLAKYIYYLIFGVPLLRSINGQSLKKNIALAPISGEWP